MRFRSYNKGGPLHYSALLRNYPAIFLVPLLPPSPPISLSVLCLRFPPCWLSSVKLCICVKKARELIFWRAGRSLSLSIPFLFFSHSNFTNRSLSESPCHLEAYQSSQTLMLQAFSRLHVFRKYFLCPLLHAASARRVGRLEPPLF